MTKLKEKIFVGCRYHTRGFVFDCHPCLVASVAKMAEILDPEDARVIMRKRKKGESNGTEKTSN